MVDNWMDITMLIVQEIFLPGSSPRCADVPLSTIDVNDEVHKELFGTNNVVIVGLTETMFAATDGNNTIYYSTAKQVVQAEVAPGAWPIPVDVRMGIAAVVYGDSGEQADDQGAGATTSMMGCRCVRVRACFLISPWFRSCTLPCVWLSVGRTSQGECPYPLGAYGLLLPGPDKPDKQKPVPSRCLRIAAVSAGGSAAFLRHLCGISAASYARGAYATCDTFRFCPFSVQNLSACTAS